LEVKEALNVAEINVIEIKQEKRRKLKSTTNL